MRIEFRILLIFALMLMLQPFCEAQTKQELGLKTVVIDPGHGGKDPGAPGKTSSTSEKHIVLKISKLFGQKIKDAYPDVKVVYTRSTDVFLELKERVNVAKKNNADLFISMHCNSNNSSQPYGASVHILGPKSKNSKNQKDYFAASMSVAQRENSVMLLEDDYKTSYQDFDPDSPESIISHSLMWNANYSSSLMFAAEIDNVMKKSPFRVSNYTGIHQDIFYLLWATNMPSALLELGFISNPSDYAYLSSADGQEKTAQRLFEAFKAYKTQYDASLNVESTPVAQTVQEEVKKEPEVKQEPSVSTAGEKWYGIQIMGLGRLLKSGDPALKGLKADAVKSEGSSIYKYVAAKSRTREQAASQLAAVRKKFPEAFLVEVDGDTVRRCK
jgi:N-acetylmuramoyl-L-alanine amidase